MQTLTINVYIIYFNRANSTVFYSQEQLLLSKFVLILLKDQRQKVLVNIKPSTKADLVQLKQRRVNYISILFTTIDFQIVIELRRLARYNIRTVLLLTDAIEGLKLYKGSNFPIDKRHINVEKGNSISKNGLAIKTLRNQIIKDSSPFIQICL